MIRARFRSSAHSMSPLPQNSKLLSKFKGLKLNQSRSASTFEQKDTGSVTGNKHHDQSQYKANKKQYASAYQNIEQSRSGRRNKAQLQDSATSSKVSSKGPKGPTTSNQTMNKKNDSLSRSEQQGDFFLSKKFFRLSFFLFLFACFFVFCSNEVIRNRTNVDTNF